MQMGKKDQKETHRQIKCEKRKITERELEQKRIRKLEEDKNILMDQEEQYKLYGDIMAGEDEVEKELDDSVYILQIPKQKQKEEGEKIVDWLLHDRLGHLANLVKRYLVKPSKRNHMPVHHCATASLRYNISSAAAAAVATGFIQDLIDSSHLSPDLTYLACDPQKLSRARQAALNHGKEKDKER